MKTIYYYLSFLFLALIFHSSCDSDFEKLLDTKESILITCEDYIDALNTMDSKQYNGHDGDMKYVFFKDAIHLPYPYSNLWSAFVDDQMDRDSLIYIQERISETQNWILKSFLIEWKTEAQKELYQGSFKIMQGGVEVHLNEDGNFTFTLDDIQIKTLPYIKYQGDLLFDVLNGGYSEQIKVYYVDMIVVYVEFPEYSLGGKYPIYLDMLFRDVYKTKHYKENLCSNIVKESNQLQTSIRYFCDVNMDVVELLPALRKVKNEVRLLEKSLPEIFGNSIDTSVAQQELIGAEKNIETSIDMIKKKVLQE